MNRWLAEMDGQRRMLIDLGNVDSDGVIGMRVPQLALGADAQFDVRSPLPTFTNPLL